MIRASLICLTGLLCTTACRESPERFAPLSGRPFNNTGLSADHQRDASLGSNDTAGEGATDSGVQVPEAAAPPAGVPDTGGPANPPGVEDASSPVPTRDIGRYAILISFDGLAPLYVEQLLAEGSLPAFSDLMSRGAWTHEARTSPGATVTLPNHFSMITSRPVTNGEQGSPGGGHGLLANSNLPAGQTVHSFGDAAYVSSVFDVVHDFGGRTGLFASKRKFGAFVDGYGFEHGAPDAENEDHGRSKIDVSSVVHSSSSDAVIQAFTQEAAQEPLNFAFLHLREADTIGHAHGWGSPEYLAAVKIYDQALGDLLQFLDTQAPYRGKYHLIATADHGGKDRSHSDRTSTLNFTIPLYLLSPTATSERDLYKLAGSSRQRPPIDDYWRTGAPPPLRNGDVGNLCTTLLGLPEIPDSTFPSFHDQGGWPHQAEMDAGAPLDAAKP